MDWSNLKADYERLGTWQAVADEYGVSKSHVWQQARKRGLTAGKSRSLDIDWSDLPALYESGMGFQTLADHYRCSIHAIQNAMKRLGVKARGTGMPKGYEWTEERRAAHWAATHTPEFRAKSRENLLKRLPRMGGSSANSPLERLLQAALIKAGISFETQVTKLGRYCVDIELHQAPVIIEADGALHYLPATREADAVRDEALRDAGYRIIRFTGREINRDPDGCIREVIDRCGLEPDGKPVAIIRNGMVGENNPRWRGGDQIFPCEHCGQPVTKTFNNAAKSNRKFCNSQCYWSWMGEHPEHSNRWLKIEWTGLGELYESGQTMRQLAQHYGCSVHAVQDALNRFDIPVRKPGRRKKSASP